MSTQVTTAFVQQYSANVQMLSQQMGSRLRDAVRVENVVGKNAFIDQIGSATAALRTSRHADTPQMDTPHDRRRLSLADYEYADLVDDQDKVRMLIDPTSSYARAAAAAMGRAMDDVIITAATGTANTGETGSGSASLDATANSVGSASSNDGLTLAKLREAKRKMDLNDVDPSIPRYIAVGPKQIEDLLGDTTVTSSDFNTVKALVQGELDTFMGFQFIMSNRLSVDSNDIRKCFAWAEDGLTLGIGKDISARIDERADKGYATQVYYCMSIGAVRMEEDKVVQIFCDETPD
jgi:hypothetical protein|tara:strand:- start:2482 stop:3360 length:879 start_codon:yes stop_codon:yes gene_type:complete